MELKLSFFIMAGGKRALLIVPYGIETHITGQAADITFHF